MVEYKYNAWGTQLSRTGELANTLGYANPFRYRGYIYDDETWMYWLRSRYYYPELHRFINADDVEYLGMDGELLSYNQYSYCRNSPINRFDAEGNWSLPNWAKLAIGAAAIAVGVVATAIVGGAATVVLVASLKIAATSAASGAVVGAVRGAVAHRISTGGWEGAGNAALDSAIDDACSGFMTGGIMAGATFTTVAAHGIRIQEIGRLKPSNKTGDGYLGVKYEAQKANGKYTTKSFELHSPHGNGGHNVWHWQKNTWNPLNNTINSKKAIHWTLWGKRI